jgi:hypothetical protein
MLSIAAESLPHFQVRSTSVPACQTEKGKELMFAELVSAGHHLEDPGRVTSV